MQGRGLVLGAALAIALVARPGTAMAACPTGHRADGNDCDWVGHPSHVSGASVYSRGEFIHTDFVHDDAGANVDGFTAGNPDPPQPVTGVHPNPSDPSHPIIGGAANDGDRFQYSGDFGYPMSSPRTYYDVADILEFRAALDASGLHLLVRLGALTAPDSTVVGIGIDSDRDSATGAGAWPHGANMSQQLGYDYFVTLWGSGGDIIDYTGPTPKTTPIRVAANTDARPPVIEADVPLPAGLRSADEWRTYVGSGLWNASANAWATPAPAPQQSFAPGSLGQAPSIYNLLFRPSEANSWWHETTQASDLLRGDIAQDHADVDAKLLRKRASKPAPRPTGLLNVQYRTVALGDGQGVEDVPTGNVWKGPVEPYSLVVPSDYYRDPHPRRFMFFYHCAFCQQNVWPFGVEHYANGGNNLTDGTLGTQHIQDIVDRSDMLVAGALQRGYTGAGSYEAFPGAEERDLRDVYSTVRGRDKYDIDPNKVIFSGMSMGGVTTQTMMTLYPDELAAAVSHNAATFGPNGGSPPRLGNIRNVPYYSITGDTGLDSSASTGGRQFASDLDALGYRQMYVEYVGRAHDFSLVYESLPILEKTAYREVRDPNPGRVSYQLDRASESADLKLTHDHAYWVSALELPKDAASATIDAVALPLAYKLPKSISLLRGTFTHTSTGDAAFVDWQQWDRDLTGHGLQDFDPRWQPGSDVSVKNTEVPPPEHAGANGFTVTTSYAAQTLDLDRMQVDQSRAITGWIEAKTATRLSLQTDGRAGARSVTLDGKPIASTSRGGTTTIPIPSGEHVLALGKPTCLDRRKFAFRIHQPRNARITRVDAFVNGKRRLTVRGRRVTRITLTRLPRRKFVVRIVARWNTGRRTISIRTYRGCTKSAPRTTVRR